MCGIVGLFGSGKISNKDLKKIKKMLTSIKYRGPDDRKIIKRNNHVAACARLAIVDRVKRSNIPFETERYIFSYNGELYNFKYLRTILKKEFKFTTESDTEVFIKAFEKWGIECFQKFNGMYAGSIYDKLNKKIYLIRDQLGIKPFYYLKLENKIYLSSEIKSFKEITKIHLNKKSIKEWFRSNTTPGDEILVKNVKKVEPGTVVIFDKKLKKKKFKFFNLEDTLKNNSNFNINQIDRELSYQNKIHKADTDTKSAVLLSGGLDSSLLAILLKKYYKEHYKNLLTFSCRVNFPKLNEAKYQKEIVNYLQVKNTYTNINSENFFKNFNKFSKKFEFPCFHPSLVCLDMIIKKLRNKNMKVLYTGEGADEIFIGYDWFSKVNKSLTTDQILDKINYNSTKVVETAFKLGSKNNRKINFSRKFNKLNAANKLRYLNQTIYLTKWLKSRDVIGMRYSKEIRVPYCNVPILEMLNEIKMDLLTKKILLKRLAKKYLTKFNYDRKKLGFSIPIRSWLTKKQLNNFLKQINYDGIDYYDKPCISKIFKDHFSGKKNYIRFIWTLISFELWKKEFFKQKNF